MKCATFCRTLLAAPLVVLAPMATAQSQPAAPLQVERSVKLSFAAQANVLLPAAAAIKETVGSLHFDRSAQPEVSAPAVGRPVITGGLTWWVSPAGARVSDRASGLSAFTAAVNSRMIRTQGVVHDSARGAVWFYGDALYRYRIATGELHRFRLTSRPTVVIRKAVVTAAGVWLATESGALVFDDASETFRSVLQAGNAPLVNAVAVGQTVWLATEQPRLVRITPEPNGRLAIAVSDKLPLGAPAEMYGVDDALWLLLSADHGDAYRVAYVARGADQLDVVAGRYFSLREDGERLVAATHTALLIIDPRTKSAVAQALDPDALMAAGVTFRGSSYSVKDPSEIVEQRPLDLSRGWSEPDLRGAVAKRP